MARAVWFDKQVNEKVKNASKRIIKAGCIKLSNDTKNLLSRDNGAFKAYKSRKNPSEIHWSSEPGQPPNIDTGRLKDSISWATSFGPKGGARRGSNIRVSGKGGGRFILRGIVGSNHPGARALEFGYTPRNLAPRPYLTYAWVLFRLRKFLGRFRL